MIRDKLSSAILLALISVCSPGSAGPRAGQPASNVITASTPPAAESASSPLRIPESTLKESWKKYRERFIQDDGRVIHRKQGGISTSESQGYALLRAVWMRDRDTFDRVLRWANDNLNSSARQDRLFAWKWGARADGSWGVHDRNVAADGDELIAWALTLAFDRWHEERYQKQALGILADLWNKLTIEAAGTRFLVAGEWSIKDRVLPVNPSYYLPAAYRAFARIDPSRPWLKLVDTSYLVFSRCRSRVGLPVDWCRLEVDTGNLQVSTDLYDRSSDFGYDAYRVYLNVAMDHLWHAEPRAMATLQGLDWLSRYWAVRRDLPAVVTGDGIPREQYKVLALYGAFFPALMILDPVQATVMYRQEIAPAWNDGLWGDPDDYYAMNLLWFGVALHSKREQP